MERIVVALGGNALQKAGEPATAENQLNVVASTSEHIANMIELGYNVVVAHGNGPQVGRIVLQNDYAASVTPAMPFDVCGAMSQGMIGYQIQQCLQNTLRRRGIDRKAATVVTQVEVSEKDPGFQNPTKPIGQFYTEEEAAEQKRLNPGFVFKEDAGRGWRRVVASPVPVDIVEKETIRTLVDNGFVTIAVGGGGVPVVRGEDGTLSGIAAVIDKDYAAELLAEELDADTLLILTAVEKVCIHYGKPNQLALDTLTGADARRYIADGEFAPGSMLPKVSAALRFAESKPGRKAIITSLDKAAEALQGKAGTAVTA